MKLNQHRQVLWTYRRDIIFPLRLTLKHQFKLYLGPKFEYFPWDLPECRHHHYGYSKSHIMLQANNSSNRIQNVPGFGCFENRFCAAKKTPPPSPGRPILETHQPNPPHLPTWQFPTSFQGRFKSSSVKWKCGWLVAMLLQCLQSIRDSTKLGWFHPPNKQSLTLPTTVISWRFSRTWALL